MRVAMIGLGNMGLPMARRLGEQGHTVLVHARNRPVDADIVQGWRDTPRSCVEDADVVLTSLPDGGVVSSVLEGENGVLAGLRSGAPVVDTSTIGVSEAVRVASICADAGTEFLDAPVTGGPAGAVAGTLGIMVGGSRSAFDQAAPVLGALGAATLVGPTGSGQRLKLVNQVMVAVTMAGVAEAFRLAGDDVPPSALDVLSAGMADSRLLRFGWPRMVLGDWEPGFRIEHMIKDIELVQELGADAGVELPSLGTALAQFRRAAEIAGPAAGTQAIVRAVSGGTH